MNYCEKYLVPFRLLRTILHKRFLTLALTEQYRSDISSLRRDISKINQYRGGIATTSSSTAVLKNRGDGDVVAVQFRYRLSSKIAFSDAILHWDVLFILDFSIMTKKCPSIVITAVILITKFILIYIVPVLDLV